MKAAVTKIVIIFCLSLVCLQRHLAKSAGFSFTASKWDPTGYDANIEDVLQISCQTNQPKANVSLQIYSTSDGYENAKKHFGDRLEQKGQVFIAKIYMVDSFHYRCIASYQKEEIKLELGTLFISPVPKVEIPSLLPNEDPFLVEFGGLRNVSCKARGSSNRKRRYITWYKRLPNRNVTVDSSMIYNDKVKKNGIVYDVSVLMIKNAKFDIVGDYICIRKYFEYTTSRQVRIDIEDIVKPTTNSSLNGNVTLREGRDALVAVCRVTGSPRPKRGWYKDDVLVEPCLNRSNPVCILFVSRAVYPMHHGTFKCKARNVNGTSVSSFSVFIEVPVKLKKPLKEILMSIDEQVRAECIVERANPLPTLRWEYQPYTCKKAGCQADANKWRKTFPAPIKNPNSNVAANRSQLIIPGYIEDTFYRCIGNNSFSKDVYTFALRRTGTVKSKLSPSVIAAIIVCLLLVVLIAAVFIIWYKRKLKRKYAPFLAPNPNFQYDHSVPLLRQCSRLPYDEDWEFPRARLTLCEVLGSGAFGEVWLADAEGILVMNSRNKSSLAAKRRSKLRRSLRYSNLRRRSTSRPGSVSDDFLTKIQVAVKTLKDDASPSEYKDLASELKILIHLGEHKNIVNLLGACTQDGALCIILEYCPNGNLLNFLRDRRGIFQPLWFKEETSIANECTYVDLLVAAYQIAKGMEFLASKKCVHRDLAARNILVSDDFVMKIADFGLARDIYQDDFYWKSTGGLLPAKWMSPEALFDKIYTEQSDIWSFGILLWEIFTLGGSPYPGLQTEELFTYLQEGRRMDPPYMCPSGVYGLMRECWETIPADRPPFHTIVNSLLGTLQEEVEEDTPYLNFGDHVALSNEDLDSVNANEDKKTTDDYLKLKNGSPGTWDADETQNATMLNTVQQPTNTHPPYTVLPSAGKKSTPKGVLNPMVGYRNIGPSDRPAMVRLDTQLSELSDDGFEY